MDDQSGEVIVPKPFSGNCRTVFLSAIIMYHGFSDSENFNPLGALAHALF